ncbi:MAG: branched-chain amino acid ABC transporter permease [Rhizobiaceae bacterium]|nr:branched-chain amino acid ABC transporter permease [Rhizobiaceae bacterium]
MRRETWISFGFMAAGLFLVVAAWFGDEPFTITLATKVVILSLAGVGLNLALGHGGLVSLGHAAFFGLGGYAMGILASHAQSFEPLMIGAWALEGTKSMPLIWLVAMLVAALFALPIGVLSLRTSGVYFIMITLAFAQMIYYFAISWPAYGGEDGMSIYVRNSFPGLNTLDPIQFFILCALILAICLVLVDRLVKSRFGMALEAARQNPQRVTSLGIDTFKLQLTAFVISAAITGLAGALYADLNRFVSPSMLSWQVSGEIMIFVILGGVARFAGPLAGATVFIALEHFLGGLTEFWQIWLGLLLLVVILFARGGIIGVLAGERRHG